MENKANRKIIPLAPAMSNFIPNSFQTPNAYCDQFMAFLTPEEWKVLSYTVRRIFGFQKRQDRISLSQYTAGKCSENGVQLDYGTGLCRTTIVNALRELEHFGLIHQVSKNNFHQNHGAEYELELESSKVDLNGLMARWEEKHKHYGEHIATARAAIPPREKASEGRSLSDRLPPVCPTDHPPSVRQTDNIQRNTEEIQSVAPSATSSEQLWEEMPSASASNVMAKLSPLAPKSPAEVWLFETINRERELKKRRPVIGFSNSIQRDLFRVLTNYFGDSLHDNVLDLMQNGKSDLQVIITSLKWRMNNPGIAPLTKLKSEIDAHALIDSYFADRPSY